MIKQDIFNSLNAEQEAAACAEFGSNLVLAGAGTGKTSTIVARVVYLLTKKNVKPRDIILLTFTNKAAREMKERLKKYIEDNIVDKISVSTFHSLCLRVVKKYHPDKRLVGDFEIMNLLETSYSRVIKFKHENLYAPSTIKGYIDSFISKDEPSLSFYNYLEGILEFKKEDEKEFLLEQYQIIFDAFSEDKKRYNILGFSDLLLIAREYFLNNTNSIQEIIIDEFQDTNPLQNTTQEAINAKSLFCVGDYDQSIYSFNGADLAIIENFKEREKFAVYNLSKNYRCLKPILDVAELVIKNNVRIYPKKLEVMLTEEGTEPKCLSFSDAISQYEEISELCKNKLDTKLDTEAIAILFRTNTSGDAIELILKTNEIEIQRDTKNSFMEHIEIKIIFAILKLILYKHLEYLEFLIIFSGIVSSTNKEAIESYYNMLTANNSKELLSGLKKDNGRQIGSDGIFFSNSKESVVSLLDILEFGKYTNVSSLVISILKSKFFINTINRIALNKTKGDMDKADKFFNSSLKRSEIILGLAKRYKDIEKFYKDMMRPSFNDDTNDTNKISLLTVHSSKGLEFDYVFVIDMDDKTFPNEKLMGKNGDDEERRLFYVATTRAKQEIIYTYSKRDKKGKERKPSRFLKEGKLL